MAIDEMKAIVLTDAETKKLNLMHDADILIAYQYILQRDQNTSKDFIPELKTHPFLHIQYVPTKARRDEELTITLRQNLELFESDIYIKDATIDDFLVLDEYHEKAISFIKRFLKDPLKFQKGMYLYGPYGTGKSYLLSGLAKRLAEMHIDALFVFMPDLIRNLKQSIGSSLLEKKINALKRCDILILDDLGGENMTTWFRDEILLPILHYRLNANLNVFISSNLSMKELNAQMYLNSEQNILKAARIITRIKDLTKSFEFVNRFKSN